MTEVSILGKRIHYYSSTDDEEQWSMSPKKRFKICRTKDKGEKFKLCQRITHLQCIYCLFVLKMFLQIPETDSQTEISLDSQPSAKDTLPDLKADDNCSDNQTIPSSQMKDTGDAMQPKKDFEEYVELETGGKYQMIKLHVNKCMLILLFI